MKNQMNEILKKSLEATPASPFLNGLLGAMDPSERESFERFLELRLTQKSTRPHETKPNEMNINKIPTPETDLFFHYCVRTDHSWLRHSENLERRLTIAREGFKELINAIETGSFSSGEYSRCEIKQAKETLTQTAPKP